MEDVDVVADVVLVVLRPEEDEVGTEEEALSSLSLLSLVMGTALDKNDNSTLEDRIR